MEELDDSGPTTPVISVKGVEGKCWSGKSGGLSGLFPVAIVERGRHMHASVKIPLKRGTLQHFQ